MENKKKSNVTVLILILLIITILSIFAVIVMYEIVKETKRNNLENTNINNSLTNEEVNLDENITTDLETNNYNIEGIYTYSEPNSEAVSYEFLDGKVKYSALSTAEGTYEIIGNKIKIIYKVAYDPDGIQMEKFEKEEELIIVDDNTLKSEREVDGKIYYGEYIKQQDNIAETVHNFVLYNGIEIKKDTGIQNISDMLISTENKEKYNITYYNYEKGKYIGESEGVFGNESYEGMSRVENVKKIAISQKYNAIPRTYEEITQLPEKLLDMSDYSSVDIHAIDLDGNGEKEYIVCYTVNYKEGDIGDGEPVASSGIVLFDNNYKKIANLVNLEEGFWGNIRNEQNKIFLSLEDVDYIDIDNDGVMEILIEIPCYEGHNLSIVQYNEETIKGEVGINASVKP